jgi:hypothetical protein
MEIKEVLEIIRGLSENEERRVTLYLNVERVKGLYFQNGGPESINTLAEQKFQGKGGINLGVALESQVSRTTGTDAGQVIKPEQMAIILEEFKRKRDLLLDPSIAKIKRKALLKHVTNRWNFVLADGTVVDQATDLSSSIAQEIETERENQVSLYQSLGLTRKMLIWTSSGKRVLASIMSSEYIVPDNFVSYRCGEIGILGVLEKESSSDILFISPLWVWNQGT